MCRATITSGTVLIPTVSAPIIWMYLYSAGVSKVGPDKTEPIWPELIIKFESLLKQNGDSHMLHPSAWRFAMDTSKVLLQKVKKIYSTNQVTYLETHDLHVLRALLLHLLCFYAY